MYSLLKTEVLIESMQTAIVKADEKLKQDPGHRFSIISKRLSEEKLQEYLAEKHFLLEERSLEIVELHLEGSVAKKGQLPYNSWADLVMNYCDTLVEAGMVRQFGSTKTSKSKAFIKDTLNLRIGRQAAGSTTITVLGNLAPNLFGESLLRSALESTFAILNSTDEEALISEASNLSASGILSLNKMLGSVAKEDLNIEIGWDAPDGKHFQFDGTASRLNTLVKILKKIEVEEPVKTPFSGLLFASSMDGHIVVTSVDRKQRRYKYPMQLIDKVKMHVLGEPIAGLALLTRTKSTLSDANKEAWEILELK